MIFEDSLKLFRDTDSRVNVLAVKTKPGGRMSDSKRRVKATSKGDHGKF